MQPAIEVIVQLAVIYRNLPMNRVTIYPQHHSNLLIFLLYKRRITLYLMNQEKWNKRILQTFHQTILLHMMHCMSEIIPLFGTENRESDYSEKKCRKCNTMAYPIVTLAVKRDIKILVFNFTNMPTCL